jgi:hypothetical protein
MIDLETLRVTRRSLHAAAELLLAGPQHRRSGTIRLRVVSGGFATVAAPDVAVIGCEVASGPGRVALAGHALREVADALGFRAAAPEGVYADGSDVDPDEVLDLDLAAAQVTMDAFAAGDLALRALAPGTTPVLWPEHFDLGVTVDEVNYGVSPGDAQLPEPYAYVGPWRSDGLVGDFWNMPFGAARPLSGLDRPEDVESFFEEGRARTQEASRTSSP